MDVRLSIIVPVYNVEKYIDKCLESLVNQTMEAFEIIIVVDGSTDGSIDIVKEYKEKYPEMITYYETENRGLSAARNYGISKAKADYIGFVDSDDWVDKNMFKQLYELAIKDNCDIVSCGYTKIYKNEEKRIDLEINSNDKKDDIIMKSRPYAWNKIYKKELFEKFNLKFPEGLIFEDICTVYPLMIRADKIGYINNCYYNYICYRDDSIMLQKNRNDNGIFKIMDVLNNYCKKEKIYEQNYNLICEINVRHIFYRLSEMRNNGNSKDYNLSFIKNCFEFLDSNFKDWRKVSKYANEMKYAKKFKIVWMLDELLRGKKNG
jgi:glycosyltransferase involved in cell wall biosynthesis